jgi:hypothetical protein
MGIPVNTTTEKPSTSETNVSNTSSQPSAEVSNQQSSITNPPAKSEAELAAEKLYEERIEEEYAKREGGA